MSRQPQEINGGLLNQWPETGYYLNACAAQSNSVRFSRLSGYYAKANLVALKTRDQMLGSIIDIMA